MQIKIYTIIFTLLCSVGLYAQKVSGVVTDSDGVPLIGVSIVNKASQGGTITDIDGAYAIVIGSGDQTLVYSFIGYESKSVNLTMGSTNQIVNVTLQGSSQLLDELIVTGGRVGARSRINSPVPVDIIPVAAITNQVGQVDLSQILTYIAPSFQSARQTISDGTDHIDPAQLRGLGTDQVLVLVNGKRRHQSALVNVNGTVNRGQVGTDLNAIPATSVQKIEILRDGAAAQYGSDAIAGVINIVLKNTEGLTGTLGYGTYATEYDRDLAISKGTAPKHSVTDGQTLSAGLNYGIKLGDKGFLNVTGEYVTRDRTNRGGTYTGQIFPLVNGVNVDDSRLAADGLTRNDFDMRIGNSKVESGGVVINAAYPINENIEVYAFGGYNTKKGNAAGFFRYPNGVPAAVRTNVFSKYPNGFLPDINSDVIDLSMAVGIKGMLGKFNYDLSNTYGNNVFDYTISNSVNYTQALSNANFQTSFDAGGIEFTQNTTNLDFSRKLDVLSGLNVAFGGEYRTDKYGQRAGEESSYKNYDVASGVAAGAQVFAGFQPQNAGTFSRNNVAGYLDLEQEVTDKFLVAAALRFENYSDFGATTNYKVALRYKLTDDIAVRASTSTGFRAPSMQQRFYAKTNTLFVSQPGGILAPIDAGTFTNDSKPAEILGIPKLKEETSQSFTIGTTIKVAKNFELTVDAYQVDIDDRIVLTNNFSGGNDQQLKDQLAAVNAGSANFFTNAVNTRARGIEAVATYNYLLNENSSLKFILAGTYIDNSVKKDAEGKPIIKASQTLINSGQLGNYFNREDQSRIEVANPKDKVSLTINYAINKFNVMVRAVRFGTVTYLDPSINPNNPDSWPPNTLTGQKETLDQVFDPKISTDLTLSYNINSNITFNVGANNIFDTYQDAHTHSNNISSGRFVYSRRVQQMGFNGRFVFAKVNFNF